jgi:hypothetical protein
MDKPIVFYFNRWSFCWRQLVNCKYLFLIKKIDIIVLRDIYNLTPAKVQDREILPEGVGDFPILHFLPVFDFISHF